MNDTMQLKAILEENTMASAPELVRAEKGALRCLACGHRCLIRAGRAGVCKVRFNRDGVLRVPGGYVGGVQVDPIEKKPFYHAFPGHDALSFGMLGCDLHCSYCQNWVTSQALRDDAAVAMPRFTDPQHLADLAVREGAKVMVSTYNEPLITADWAVEIFKAGIERGLTCGFVSNGNATPEVLEFIQPYVSLYKVDLKAMTEKEYRKLGCTLKNVLDTIERLVAMDFWLELVTLVVPGINDDEAQLREMAQFIAGVNPNIPWHVTAFHPDYKMQGTGPTEMAMLDTAYRCGKEAGLHFVYPGNVHGRVGDREHTKCPDCGTVLIERRGFYVLKNHMRGGHCPACEKVIPGVWDNVPLSESRGNGIPRPIGL